MQLAIQELADSLSFHPQLAADKGFEASKFRLTIGAIFEGPREDQQRVFGVSILASFISPVGGAC